MSDAEMAQEVVKTPTEQLTFQGDMAAATFSFNGEDHTLGNLMRNQIQKNAKVDFCAYSVPHPSEPVCNVRIQMASNTDADVNSALRHGLKRIQKTCDVVEEKFLASVADFKSKN